MHGGLNRRSAGNLDQFTFPIHGHNSISCQQAKRVFCGVIRTRSSEIRTVKLPPTQQPAGHGNFLLHNLSFRDQLPRLQGSGELYPERVQYTPHPQREWRWNQTGLQPRPGDFQPDRG